MQRFGDLTVGEVGTFGPYAMREPEVIEFAEKYNALPYHTDPSSPEAQRFGGVIATGWHSMAVLSRLATENWLRGIDTIAGVGAELSFRQPVRPGDDLWARLEVLDLDASSRPDRGKVRYRATLLRGSGGTALVATITMFVAR